MPKGAGDDQLLRRPGTVLHECWPAIASSYACVVSTDSCPSHSAITAPSTPPVAIRLDFNDGQVCLSGGALVLGQQRLDALRSAAQAL
jgi:hypothetical protein